MVNKKPVQHALKRVDGHLVSVLAAFVMGHNPGARKQYQIGAALIVAQKEVNAKFARRSALLCVAWWTRFGHNSDYP
jgi:hypothetical protein